MVSDGSARLADTVEDASAGPVGVLGLGKVGEAVANVLAESGTPPLLYNRTRSKAESIGNEIGAEVARDPRELSERCQIVISALGGPDAVRQSYFGETGLLSRARAGLVVVELAMLTPMVISEIAAATSAAGAEFLCATVTGRPGDLRRGAGYVLTSGSEVAAHRAARHLLRLGKVRHLGDDPTHASAMKLVVNVSVFSAIGSTAEALALARSSGLSPEIAYDVLLESPMSSDYLRLRREAFLHPDGTPPVTATLGAAVGNYDLILELAREKGVSASQAEATRAMMQAACDAGFGERDATSLANYVDRITEHSASESAGKGDAR